MEKAPYVIHLADSRFDLGVYPAPDGSFELRTDWFGGHVEKILGVKASSPATQDQAKLGKLYQRYSLTAAEESARRKGLMCRRITRESGAITLELTGPGL